MKTSSIIVVGLIVIALLGAAAWYSVRTPSPSQGMYTPSASSGAAPAPVAIANPFGIVTAVSANGFTFTSGTEAKKYTVHTTSSTKYLVGTSTPTTAASVKVGSFITIPSSTTAADGSLNAVIVTVLPPPPPISAPTH